jgi:membrane fusion protein, adhesin transport system
MEDNKWILEESFSRRWIRTAMLVICLILFFFVVWISVTNISETVIGMGELQPIGGISIINHVEGGAVTQIFVKNGDYVRQGDPLVQLNDSAVKSELERMRGKAEDLSEDKKRLTDFIHNKKASTENSDSLLQSNQILDDHFFLLLQEQSKADQLDLAAAEISKKQKEILKLQDQEALTAKQLDLAKQEEKMYVNLVDQGVVSKKEYLRNQVSRMELEKTFVGIKTQCQQAEDDLLSAKANYAKTISTLNESAAKDLNTIETELGEVNQSLPRLEDSLSRMTIRAPVDGIVKGLELNIGGVVPPGGFVLSLIPQNINLEALIRVQPQDIGFVHSGEKAIVKISAYDFSRYGVIDGLVTQVSASTDKNEKNEPYYKVIVKLGSQYVHERNYPLQSGMTVQVDIITGSKTILQYLLKPIHLTFNNGLHER